MGSDISTQGVLKIVLEKYEFFPGEQVRGSINIVLAQPIPPSKLYLRFKGVEHVKLGKLNRRYKDRWILKAPISKTDYLLMTWETPVQPSQFSIPFSLVLPSSLQGSFSYMVPRILLLMKYKVKALLKGPEVYIKNTQDLLIKTNHSMHGPHEDHVTAKVTAWCFKKKGTIDFNVRWINDKYSSTTPLECIIDIDNSKSLANIKGIEMSASCIARAAINTFQDYRRTIRMPMCNSTLKVDIKPGEKCEGDKGIRYIISFNSFPRIPEFLPKMCTYEGRLFSCAFFIDIDLVLDTHCLCCGDRPGTARSFILDSEVKFDKPNIEVPNNWNPQVYRPAEFVYDHSLEAEGTQFKKQGKNEGNHLDQTKFS